MSPTVKWAEPNYICQYHNTPPDEKFPLQWGLHNIGQAPFYGTPGADIDFSRAWDINDNQMPQTKIAIIDSGIDTLHYDLYTQIWHNPIDNTIDSVNEDHNYIVFPNYPEDTCWLTDDIWGWDFTRTAYNLCGDNYAGPSNFFENNSVHATAVSGIAGASAITEKPPQPLRASPGFLGIVGVTWNCKLMSLKISDADYGPTYSAAAFAVQYAADKRADVINMSFGGRGYSDQLNQAILYAYRRGCVLVASMGNCNYPGCGTPIFPSTHDSVLAVGGTDCFDSRWYEDTLNGSSTGTHIDVVGPAKSIIVDFWMSWAGDRDAYAYGDGTSLSSPLVAGEAALIKGQYKKLYPYQPFSQISNLQLMDIIRWSAEDSMYYPVSDTTWDDSLQCHGRINAFRGMLAVSRGEVNHDHVMSVADITYLIAYLFQGGPMPIPVKGIGDANCDGYVTIGDVAYLANFFYKGGPKPGLCFKWYY